MDPNIYRPLPAEILDIRAETTIDSTYRLRWDGTAPQPGQFFQVSVLRVGEAPISASGWGDGWIELTIRNVGRVTSAIFDREIGDSIHLRGPYGTPFPLDEYAGRHTIVSAGGTGLASVRGLIRHLLATCGTEAGPSAVTILAGFKSPEDMLFTANLDTWAEQVPVSRTVDRADSSWSGHVGVITTLIPDLDIPDRPRRRPRRCHSPPRRQTRPHPRVPRLLVRRGQSIEGHVICRRLKLRVSSELNDRSQLLVSEPTALSDFSPGATAFPCPSKRGRPPCASLEPAL